MKCKSIELEHFRNVKEARVSFGPGVNVLVGDNAQGKTNLLEAVYLSAIGKSFRGAKDAEMISFGQDQSKISLNYEDDVREMNVTTYLRAVGRRKMEQNGVGVSKMSELVGTLRVVLFCPEHLSLIKAGPEMRRNFMDVAISQLRPLYLTSLQKYHKILKERNRLLKDAATDEKSRRVMEQTVDVWSAQLAREGALIAQYRRRYVQSIHRAAAEVFADMTDGRERACFSYLGACKLQEEEYEDRARTERKLYELLTTSLDREIGAACTLWGPHRDDVGITLNGAPARLFASQGQQRSLSLAMKLGEGEISCKTCGENPVYLFDDVQSELDAHRREYLTRRIRDKQVILTTCEPSELQKKDEANVIFVKDGTFSAV